MHYLKQDITGMHLRQDTPHTPQINTTVVRMSNDNFRGTIRPTLYVGGKMIGGETTTTEINQLNFTS